MIEGRLPFALIDAVWQGVAIALIAWLVLRAIKTNAATRCAVWVGVLILVAILPLANLVSRTPSRSLVQTRVAPQTEVRTRAVTAVTPRRRAGAVAPAAPTPQAPSHTFVIVLPPLVLRITLGFIAAVAAVRLFALLLSFVRLRRLIASARPLERRFPVAVAAGIRLFASDAIAVPLAIGLGRRAIVLPEALLAKLNEADLDRVLLHEAAHLARRDDVTNLIERLALALLFFHPAVHLAVRKIDLEREIACDDWVIAATGSRQPYAWCLTALAEFAVGRRRSSMPALGLFSSRRALRTRIEHVLDATANVVPRRSRFAAAAIVALCALALAIGAFRLPVVATPLASTKPKAARVTAPIRVAKESPASFVRSEPLLIVLTPAPLPPLDVPIVRVRAVEPPRVPLPDAIQIADVEDPATAAPPDPPPSPPVDVHVPDVHIPPIHIPEIRIPEMETLGPLHHLNRETVRGADYRNKDLRNTVFSGKMLIDPDFRGADLRGVHFVGSTLANPKFAGAKLAGVSFMGTTITNCACAGLDFSGARFMGATVIDSDFSRTSFAGAELMGARFTRTKMMNVNLSDATMRGASF